MNFRMKRFLVIFCIFYTFQAFSQSGTIEYERKTFWITIMSKLPFMTQEQIDRDKLTWGKREGQRGQPYTLYFNPDNSLYTYSAEESNEYGYSWKKDPFIISRNYKENSCYDQLDFAGRNYILKEEAPKYKWKILNEIKEIAGYLCMKAETVDTVKGIVVHAWFSDLVPAFVGPEGYDGLPGAILGLTYNNGDIIIEATKVNLSEQSVELPFPKKMRGKEISRKELHAKQQDYIAVSIEGKRNPYWQMRY